MSIAGVLGTVFDALTAAETLGLKAGVRERPSSATIAAAGVAFGTGCASVTTGEAVEEALEAGTADGKAGLAPGGGGRGAIPTPFLSLAAAAAAAEAYLSVSPGRRVGGGAGFMPDAELLELDGCSVARTGSGDFI